MLCKYLKSRPLKRDLQRNREDKDIKLQLQVTNRFRTALSSPYKYPSLCGKCTSTLKVLSKVMNAVMNERKSNNTVANKSVSNPFHTAHNLPYQVSFPAYVVNKNNSCCPIKRDKLRKCEGP